MNYCQPLLYRKRQILASISSSCDVAEPLDAADGILRVDVGSDGTPELNMNERNLALPSLSRVPNVPGAIVGKQAFTSEILGSGALTDVPDMDVFLRGCGFNRLNLHYLDIKVPPASETIARGATLEGAISGALARVVLPVDAATTRIFVEIISGTFQADESIDIQGGSSGVFVNKAEQVLGGYEYKPRSQDFEYLTIMSEEDGVFKMMRGALGTVSFSAEASGIGKAEFDFTGVVDKKALTVPTDAQVGAVPIAKGTLLYSGEKVIELLRKFDTTGGYDTILFRERAGVAVADDDVFLDASGSNGFTINGTPTKAYSGDRALTANVPFRSTVPPILQDSECKLGTFTPVYNSLSLDVGNNVIPRPDANDPTGLASAYITERNVSGTYDPEMVSTADFDFLGNWFNGDLFYNQVKFGSEEGNTVWFILPEIQAQSVGDQEREGMAGVSWEFEAKGADDSELAIIFV